MGFAGLSPAAFAADKPKQEVSRVIAKEISAAQKAMQASQWSEAVKNLEAAETKSPLTTYDKKSIADLKAFCYVRLNNLKAAQTAYEQALATGGYTPEELPKTYRLLFQLAATNKSDAKAIEYGKQASDAGSATDDDLMIMSQLYYQQKDCKNSAVWGDKAIAAFKKAGQPPKEVLYQIKLQCASDANDTNAMKAGLYDLVRLTNKTSYWNNLIRLERQDERDDNNTRMIYRIMFDTNSMNADTDYIEMAQLLGDASLPGEAQGVLEKAVSSGVLKEEHKERTNRLLASLKTRADADKKALPQLDAEAQKNPAGQLDVKLGEVYFGAGDYQNAVTAISRGIGKGQVKQLDEAYVYLGRAQVALKNNAEAKKAFEKLKTVPNESPRVLKLWELYSDKLGS
ncbi:MAG TPA: tetratricopeptide repeat protein [Steroidobacteraceae bacterium]|nr:tetratricopeptide repeat protein [Steroidobacteraceae bacterium]